MESTTATPELCSRCAGGSNADDAERAAEAAGWHALHSLVDSLTPEQAMRPGYFPEGWTVRDVVGHIGAWLAEAGQLLEQMRAGTYVEGELDVDAANAHFFELMRDLPLDTVHLQAWSARSRMLAAWAHLPSPPSEAARFWLRKAGAEHYEEHLPRLREWIDELRARPA